jgi:hypothetical protein
MAELAERFRKAVDFGRLDRLAKALCLSDQGLGRLGIGWCDESRAWSFPMQGGRSQVVGIRLRTELGRKFSVRGGHEGVFIPTGLVGGCTLLLPEGPTDTAALLDLGFEAVGRPNNNGGKGAILALVHRLCPVEAIIVADNDGPGRDGALGLAQRLVIHVPRLRIITPPRGIKDARAWKQAGASHEEIQGAIEAAVVHRLSTRVEEVRRGR